MPDLKELSPVANLALKTAARNLRQEFEGTFSVETIEQFLATSYDQFADRASVTNFLPLMAERFARQRLHALARIEGRHDDGLPIVLFLCIHNAGRSQMALGWFNHLAEGRAIAWSGGSEPARQVNPAAVQAMAEVGIDIVGEYPKPWTDEIVRAADVVITMGCGDACRSSRASATKTGCSTTPPDSTSTPCGRSGMRSADASKAYSTTSPVPRPRAGDRRRDDRRRPTARGG